MNPILFSSTETNFTTNGLGRLTDCISCKVAETINGVYELAMVYPITGVRYKELRQWRLVYAVHDDSGEMEPFEIYRITRPLNGKVTVNAWHISYRLMKILARPIDAYLVGTALSSLKSESITSNPFNFSTSKTDTGVLHTRIPRPVREIMGGGQFMILDLYDGEWEFKHFNCNLLSRRGTDTDLTIQYGKNLADMSVVTDISDLWTGVVPYWAGRNADDVYTTVYYDGVIWSPYRNQFDQDMVIAVDASDYYGEVPTQTRLREFGESYVANNARSLIPSSINVSFVQLWQTEEYKDIAALQRLHIGDVVHIAYDDLGVNASARVVSYVYNVLSERYDSMVLGDDQMKLVSEIRKDIVKVSKMQQSASLQPRPDES